MVKIVEKRGAFLTLGITFVSVVVLTLAALILRNAEMSEERMGEFAIVDRVYNLEKSIGVGYREMMEQFAKFNITVTDTSIEIIKNSSNTPSTSQTDAGFLQFTLQRYIMMKYLEVTYPGFIAEIIPSIADLTLIFKNTGTAYWFFFGNFTANFPSPSLQFSSYSYAHVMGGNQSLIKAYNISLFFAQDEEPYINWTRYTPNMTYPPNAWINLTVYGKPGHVVFNRSVPIQEGKGPCTINASGSVVCNDDFGQIIHINNTKFATNLTRSLIVTHHTATNVFNGPILAVLPVNGSFLMKTQITYEMPIRSEILVGDSINYTIQEFEIMRYGPLKIK